MNLIQKLTQQNLISPPKWLPLNVHYLTLMGSYAYGTETPGSDRDVYGVCVPPKDMVFPHLAGDIPGFGEQKLRFDVWQEHHIKSEPEYDCSVYSIVRYFHLCMENNPNMLDSLYTPHHAVIHETAIGQTIRKHRDLFLHAGYWHKAKGFAYSQLHKMDVEERQNPQRMADIQKYGYDLKFGYHTVRLMLQAEQALLEGTLDLTRHSETLKAIRRGEWTKEKVRNFFDDKERSLEEVYTKCHLPWGPNVEQIKGILLTCLEMHYGSLPVPTADRAEVALNEIANIVARYKL